MDPFLNFQRVPVITPHGNEFISFTHNRSYVGPSQKFGPFVSEAYELYVHVEGTCNILIEDRIFSPKCGDLFLYPIRRPHNLITKSDIYERFIVFFSPHVFDSIVCDQPLLRLFDTNEAGRNHVMLPGDVCQEIMRKLRQASEAIQSGAPDLPYTDLFGNDSDFNFRKQAAAVLLHPAAGHQLSAHSKRHRGLHSCQLPLHRRAP